MKIYGKLLALGVFNPNVWGTAAFVVKAPKAEPSVALLSSLPSGDSQATGTGAKSVRGMKSSTGAALRKSKDPQDIWAALTPVLVQGGSLKTWSFTDPSVERAQVVLKTDGRPLNAMVELWQGPDNTPQKMGIYVEDGSKRNFRVVIETPRSQNAICVRNTAQLEFPLSASVEADADDDVTKSQSDVIPETIQGGALKTYTFAPSVASVRVCLKTDGRPLNSRIELLQGPNNIKQVMEIYTEDGIERPFYAVLETPGTGNVVRILNTAPMEFPLAAVVEPYLVVPVSSAPIVS